MDKSLTGIDRLLKALADPTRLRIVGMLQGGEVCVCHIHENLKITQTKASRHLAYLRRAGVVQTQKRGLWVYYRIAPQSDVVAQTILNAVRHGVTHLPTVQRDVVRLEKSVGGVPTTAIATMACCGGTVAAARSSVRTTSVTGSER